MKNLYSTGCTNHKAGIVVKDIEPVRQPDCTYRAVVKWSVNYDIDVLESLISFRLYLSEMDNPFNIVSQEKLIPAIKMVCCFCKYTHSCSPSVLHHRMRNISQAILV